MPSVVSLWLIPCVLIIAVNGITSLPLAILLLLGWPKTTPVIIGLFISISLVFDGNRRYNDDKRGEAITLI